MLQDHQEDSAAAKGAAPETTALFEYLISRTGKGDKDAFCNLYLQTKRILYSYALSILHNREEAEDAAQDTFLKIRSAAHLYTPMGKPLAWMLTIERNICLMRLRAQSRFSGQELTEETGMYRESGSALLHAGASSAASLPRGGAHQSSLAGSMQDSFSHTQDVENRLTLEKAMHVLSQEESSIVLLHTGAGMKHREIADQLGIPLSTVLSKYRRALEKLRRQLQGTVP